MRSTNSFLLERGDRTHAGCRFAIDRFGKATAFQAVVVYCKTTLLNCLAAFIPTDGVSSDTAKGFAFRVWQAEAAAAGISGSRGEKSRGEGRGSGQPCAPVPRTGRHLPGVRHESLNLTVVAKAPCLRSTGLRKESLPTGGASNDAVSTGCKWLELQKHPGSYRADRILYWNRAG
jgi:hypothetical protein